MVERNYRTWCAQNDLPLEEGLASTNSDTMMDVENETGGPGLNDEEEWGGIMDVDDDIPDFLKEDQELARAQASQEKTRPKHNRSKVGELVREKVRKVLEDETGLADKRAGKCDEGDFLKLLWAFNKEGIHFS